MSRQDLFWVCWTTYHTARAHKDGNEHRDQAGSPDYAWGSAYDRRASHPKYDFSGGLALCYSVYSYGCATNTTSRMLRSVSVLPGSGLWDVSLTTTCLVGV